jgi:formiminotetrahydrofolate cyclodeaminase
MSHKDQTIAELLSRIASERVAPAGGTAAAIVGAIGAALCEMTCVHTVNKRRSEGETADLAAVGDELRRQRAHLLRLADTDASVVDDLFSGADGEMDQSEIKRSVGVPLTIADACLNVLNLAIAVTEDGDKNAVLDAGTGVCLAHSALRASVFTVRSNVDQVAEPAFVSEVERRVTEIAESGDESYQQAMENIEKRT